MIAAIAVAHLPLLRLPFFWDEAGYYIPAARDFLLHGSLIPHSTLHTAHTPLLSLYLAAIWKVAGYGILASRLAMLAVASFGLWQVFRLAENVSNRSVAIAATLLTAVYPVVFAQSSLAHSDLLATALVWWGLREYFEASPRPWKYVVAFTLAALAKEISIVVPCALAAFELTGWKKEAFRKALSLTLIPSAALLVWFSFHRWKTGHWFGDPDYYRYNVSAAITPLRIVLAFVQRAWQAFGHMSMWVLTIMTAAAMLHPARLARHRIAIPIQLAFATVIFATLLFHSILGGALLTRYLLPIYPLIILIGVSTWWRRVPHWEALVAFTAAVFLLSCYINPPYRFAPEDNLNYAEFVRLHQRAAQILEEKYARTRILSAWPASDELSKPELGYVSKPLNIVPVKNFTAEELIAAGRSDFDVALIFSTKYEPPRPLFESKWWLGMSYRFFDYHRDVTPFVAAQIVGGRIGWYEARKAQWAAIIERTPRQIENAKLVVSIDPRNSRVR